MLVDKDVVKQLSLVNLYCLKLIQKLQKFDVSSATVNDIKTLIPVLQSIHSVCLQMYIFTNDLSVLNPVTEIFSRANKSISVVSEDSINGMFITLVILLEKALLESLFDHLTSTKANVEPLSALVKQLATPEFIGAVQKLMGDCFKPGKHAEPMAVDGTQKREEPDTAQSIVKLLNPNLQAETKSQQMVSCEPLLSSEYCSFHADIFDNFREVVTLALVQIALATFKITKPEGMFTAWEPLVKVAVGAPTSRYLRKTIKAFAKFVCADEVIYLMIRDGNMLDTEVKWLENEATRSDNFTAPLSSSEASRAIDHLSALTKLSKKRETVWKAYCVAHPATFKLFYSILSCIAVSSLESVPAELLTSLMFLLSVSLSDIPPSTSPKNSTTTSEESKKVTPSEATPTEKEFILFIASDVKNLDRFARAYSLQCTDSNVRKHASTFLLRAWYHTSQPECKCVLKELYTKMIQSAPVYGAQSKEFMKALGRMFQPHPESEDAESPAVRDEKVIAVDPKVIVSLLRSQNRVLLQHPNASLYNRVESMMGGPTKYWFEPRPCLRCNAASTEFQDTDLGSISNQMRATSTARFYRLKNTYKISSIHITIQKRRSSSRTVKVLNIYVNTRRVSDVIDLRDNWDLWKRVQSVRIPADSTDSSVSFPCPLSAANICFEVAELHEESRRESLKCPRCSNSVPDRHGVCSHCGENAYQCRNCRYIPYENYDAFFCPQCGQCKDCQFEVTLCVCQSFVPEPVESDEDLKKATETLDTQTTEASNSLLRLSSFRTEAALHLYP